MVQNVNIQKSQHSSSDDGDMSSDEQEAIEDIPVAQKCSEYTLVSSCKLVSSINPSNDSSNCSESPRASPRLSSTSDLDDMSVTEITPTVVRLQELSKYEDQDDMASKILPHSLKNDVAQEAASISDDVMIKVENRDSEKSPFSAIKLTEIHKNLEVDATSDISLFVNHSRTSSQSSFKSLSSSNHSDVYNDSTGFSTDYVKESSKHNQEADCVQETTSAFTNFEKQSKEEALEEAVATDVSYNLNNYAETRKVSYSYELVNKAENKDPAINQQNTLKKLRGTESSENISIDDIPFTEKHLRTSSSSSSKSVASTQSNEGPSVFSKANSKSNSEFEYVQKDKLGLENANVISEQAVIEKNTSNNLDADVDKKAVAMTNEMESKDNFSGFIIKQQNGMIEQKSNEFY